MKNILIIIPMAIILLILSFWGGYTFGEFKGSEEMYLLIAGELFNETESIEPEKTYIVRFQDQKDLVEESDRIRAIIAKNPDFESVNILKPVLFKEMENNREYTLSGGRIVAGPKKQPDQYSASDGNNIPDKDNKDNTADISWETIKDRDINRARELVGTDKYDEAEQILLSMIREEEALSKRSGKGVTLLPYEELANLYKKQNDTEKEKITIERFFRQKPAPGVNFRHFKERLDALN